ncbi:MAG: hypothetical protein ACOVRN_10430 [Flavobacterium sp.]
MTELEILYAKEGFTFAKHATNQYSLRFAITNDHMVLTKIVDFPLIKLIYDLNTDIYEYAHLTVINEQEATINLLMRHLFEDLGLPQRFSYLHVKKTAIDQCIQFTCTTIRSERPAQMPPDAELMPIQTMSCICRGYTNHRMECEMRVHFDDSMRVPAVAEKMVGMILFKIFKRVKQFIEDVRI